MAGAETNPARLSAFRRMGAFLRPYALALAAQCFLVFVAYILRHKFGVSTGAGYTAVNLVYLGVLVWAAWLGYGPGLLAWTLALTVVPKILGTRPGGRPFDPIVLGLVLLVSLLISRLGRNKKQREKELLQAAADLEVRVQERTEEALRAGGAVLEAEERLRFLLDAAGIGYWDYDIAADATQRSLRHDQIFGYTEPLAQMNRATFLKHVHPADRPAIEAQVTKTITGNSPSLEFRIVRPDQSVHWVWLQGRATHIDAAGNAGHISGIIVDITDRKRTEEELREQAQLLNLAHDAILSLDWNGTIRFWSRGAEEMYGWTAAEALGRISHELLKTVFPERLREIERKADALGHWEGELVHTRKDGSTRRVASRWAVRRDSSGRPLGFLEINTDITEKRRIEEQLRHTQKLESLGVLAGGVAHDFNNLLTGILGNASLALENTRPHSSDRVLVEEVMKAAERAADLTRQLLAYAGKGRFVMRTVNLSEMVREISGLVQTSIPKTVQVRLQLADPLPGIDADPGQLQQIIMNLVINGAEAIGPEGGTVLVRTTAQDVDEQYLGAMPIAPGTLKPGRHVCLEVHDTGSGMDAETIAKIFDPFFTTKFAGRGLGLSAVLGIVNAHKGALKVYSVPGEGTTFKVLFPASLVPLAVPQSEVFSDLAGTGTVLVVDDEEVVRQAARHTLERYGYRVLTAVDGSAAVDLYQQRSSEIALVLLDLTMPVMSGEEALRRMQSVRPQVRVLLSSGYNEVEAVQRFAGKGLAGFIQKPYTAAGLAEKVKEVIVRREDTEVRGKETEEVRRQKKSE